MKHQYTIDIDAPIETVFDLIDNPEKSKLWMEGLEDTTYTSDDTKAMGAGTTFKQRIREGAQVVEYDGEITHYRKPEYLAMHIGDGNFTMHVEYKLVPLDSGTRLHYASEGEVHTWYGQVMEALYSWFTKRIIDRHLDKLKQMAEDPAAFSPMP